MKKVALLLLLTLILLQFKADLFYSTTQAAEPSQEIIFHEDFEQDLSKWQILKEEVPDSIEITSSRGYLSSKSLLLDYQNPQNYLHLKREFSSASDVLVRVFFFDNLDESLGSIIEINDSAGSVGTGLGVVSALYPNTYAIRINSLANTKDTKVSRSNGWHMLEFVVTGSGTYAKIDNEKVAEFNASQTSIASVSLVSTWELTGQVFYDEILVVKADKRSWLEQLYNPLQSFYLVYKDTDFSGLYPSLGLGMHSNDLRSVIDTGFAFYIYGKKVGDQTAITRGKQLLLDALTYGKWNQTNDWARGIYMASFTRAAYSMWDEFDNQTKADIKKLIFDQAQTYLTRFPESGYIGDTKAEENAWHADFLAAIVNFFPSVPNRTALEEKAKCFAYHAITTSKDAAYCGVKTQTVYDDFKLENHDLINPVYAAAAIHFLAKGGLSYTITGKNIPDEFKHNVENLYTNFLRPYTDLNTFYPQNLPTKLDWSGANNTLYYGTLAYAYLDHLGVPLSFSLNDHMQKRSLFFYNIASEWVQKTPASINSWNQINPNSDNYRWFLDNNNAGNVYATTITLVEDQIPNPITIPGDANGDGKVDGLDYIIWLNNYSQTTSNDVSDGDFNQDGTVNGLDYVVWLNNYGS